LPPFPRIFGPPPCPPCMKKISFPVRRLFLRAFSLPFSSDVAKDSYLVSGMFSFNLHIASPGLGKESLPAGVAGRQNFFRRGYASSLTVESAFGAPRFRLSRRPRSLVPPFYRFSGFSPLAVPLLKELISPPAVPFRTQIRLFYFPSLGFRGSIRSLLVLRFGQSFLPLF